LSSLVTQGDIPGINVLRPECMYSKLGSGIRNNEDPGL
jgi:hypothetical protein